MSTLKGRTLWIGIAALLVVAAGAGLGGYELGLRAERPGTVAATISPVPSPVPSSPPASSSAQVLPSLPAARSGASWAFDPVTGKFVLFGGYNTTGNFNEFPHVMGDTWTWDGKSWSQVTSAGPSPRRAARVVYDGQRKVIVLHGGNDAGNGDADTWTWDGTRWLLMGPSQSPAPFVQDQPLAFDSAHGTAVLFYWSGIWSGPSPDQTWTWDGTNWHQVQTTTQPQGHIGFAAMAYDPAGSKVVFYQHVSNGEPPTWTFDGNDWTAATNGSGTTSQTFAMAEDDATSSVVLFGENGDTWIWKGGTWTPANPVHSPGPRADTAMAYDSIHHVVTLFGGHSGTNSAMQHHNDIWTWNGTDWTKVSGD